MSKDPSKQNLSLSEDRMWSQNWFCKQWRGDELHWEMEVRTEQFGVGTRRLGELEISGKPNGELTLAIHETDWDTKGD